jgi:pSer/pThr/pTyr-binding forkhead associated (FHA) protein
MTMDGASPESTGNVGAVPIGSLTANGGLSDGETLALDAAVTWIGRAPDSDLVLNDERASRQHAGIRRDRLGYWIKDRGSRNGTYVNGVRIVGEGKRLQDMDRVEFGAATDVHWTFHLEEA